MTIRRILLTAFNVFSPNQIFNIIHRILKLTSSQQVNRNVYPPSDICEFGVCGRAVCTVLWTASFQCCQREWGDMLKPVKIK